GQDVEEDAAVAVAGVDERGGVQPDRRRQLAAVGVGAMDGGQRDLLEVVAALDALGGRAHLLDGGDEQADQDGDDRDDHQQLDQREPALPAPGEETDHSTTPRSENTRESRVGGATLPAKEYGGDGRPYCPAPACRVK